MREYPTTSSKTVYDGPTTIDSYFFGGREIRVARPQEPDRLLDAPEVRAWNERDDYMPYWAYLWPGAYLLAEAVAREPLPEGLSAIEIGCGLGLAGLVALSRGLRVQFTDYDEAAFPFIERSARENGIDPSCFSIRYLDWRRLPDVRFPLILGADVLYEKRLVPLVANLLAQMLAPGGLALIAGPYRTATEGFEEALHCRGLIGAVEHREASGEHGLVRGTLHRVRRSV